MSFLQKVFMVIMEIVQIICHKGTKTLIFTNLTRL